MIDRGSIAVGVGGVIAMLLQIVIAPNIAISYAMPNFVLAYVLALAVARPARPCIACAFVMGLAFNLFAGGPVGGMAFLLVLAAFLISRAFTVVANESLFMPILAIVIASLAVEFLYGGLIVAVGSDGVGLFDAFLLRALPCALYDCVAGLVCLPLVMKFVVPRDASHAPIGTTTLR